MDFIGVVIVLAIGWWLKSAINDLKRRLATSEMGVADLRRQLTDLQRRVGSQAAPPEAPAAPPQTEPQPTPVEDATRAEPPAATPPPSSVPPVAQSTWTSSTGSV